MITVFGSINVDMVMQVAALPRPGETVLCPGYLLVPGGKGANQALAAARAGAGVRMVGCVGRDRFAETALSLLRRQGVDLSGICESSRPTCCATVWVDNSGENAIVVASGANLDVSAGQVEDAAIGPDDLLVLQMEVPHDENWAVAKRAKARGARVILSVAPAAPVPEAVFADLDMILVNQVEGAMVAETVQVDATDPATIPAALARRFGVTCVMTLGAKGALAATPERTLRVPTLPISPVDTTAAGDAFAGVLAATLDGGHGLEDALRRASAAAGLACTHVGAQTSLPDADAIDAALADLPPVESA
jgi:ribokinase